MRRLKEYTLVSRGRLVIVIAAGLVAALALGLMVFGPDESVPRADVPRVDMPVVVAPAVDATPVRALSPHAKRLYYAKGKRDNPDGPRAWGSACALLDGDRPSDEGYISVDHVTINADDLGPPLVGPTASVTARDALSDWSFLGVDPATLDHRDYPMLAPGMIVEIHGFPARDRDGEIVPGMVYMDDPDPETLFVWIELLDSPAPGVPGEGVVGGLSGSCGIVAKGKPAFVVSANGFSVIAGTTNTWAKVVPTRAAIRAAQGLPQEAPPRAMGIMGGGPREVPEIETGRWGMVQ